MRPQIIDYRFRVLDTLHNGDVVSVYLAEDLITSATIALKVANRTSSSPQVVDSLKQEYLLLTQLMHPNIVLAQDFGYCQTTGHYFSMDYLGKTTLATLGRAISPSLIRVVLLQVSRALDYLGSRGILHRDVSPANIIVASDNHISAGVSSSQNGSLNGDSPGLCIRLIDFGTAGHSMEKTDSPIRGTLPYIAPEVLQFHTETDRSEVYSLGMALLDTLDERHSTMRTSPISSAQLDTDFLMRYDLDDELRALLVSMVHSDPALRPSPGEIATLLGGTTGTYAHSETPDGLRSYLTHVPLRGRENVFNSMQASLRESTARQTLLPHSPRAYFLGGETGTGKTRLVRDVAVFSQLIGVRAIIVHCGSQAQDSLKHLRSIVDTFTTTSVPVVTFPSTDVRSAGPLWYRQYVPYARGTISDSSLPVPLSIPHSGHDNDRLQALHGLANQLKTTNASHPLALIFENLNHGDAEILELVRLLTIQYDGPFILGTFQIDRASRSNLDAFLRYFDTTQTVSLLRLERLTSSETAAFIAKALGERTDTTQLADHIYLLTSGNPLLIQETLLNLCQLGHLVRRNGSWLIDLPEIRRINLPTNLHTFAIASLESLGPRNRRILEVMATFDSPINLLRLAEFTGRETSSLREDLSHLVCAGLVVQETCPDDALFRLRHRCVREVVYQEMDPPRRRSLHGQIASVLERTSSPCTGELLDQVALHFIEALDLEKGPEYAFRAAHAAMERFATRRAIEMLVSGLNLTGSKDIPRRFEGLETLGALLWLSGDLSKAADTYHEMLLLARKVGSKSKEALAIREIAWILVESGEMERGLAYARDAEGRFRNMGDPVGAVRAVLIQAQALRKIGDYALASRVASCGYDESLKTGDVYCQSLARMLDGLVANDRGDYDRAISLLQDALRLKAEIDDIAGIAVTLNDLGLVYLEKGDLVQARPYFERCLREARSKGLPLPAILASINLGEISSLRGEMESATVILNEALSLAETSGRKQFVGYTLFGLAQCLLLQGEFSKAINLTRRAEEALSSAAARLDLSLLLICKTELYGFLGGYRVSRASISHALTLATEVDNPQAIIAAKAAAAVLHLNDQEARTLPLISERDLEEGRQRGKTSAFTRMLGARVLALSCQGIYSGAFDTVAELKSIAKEAGLRPELVRAALLEGQALLKLKRRAEARAVLEQGAEMAREMGLRPLLSHILYWLSQAQEAVGDAAAAAESVFEAADLINAMAAAIAEEEYRKSYLEVPINLAAMQHAERLQRAGLKRRSQQGSTEQDPDAVAEAAFDEVSRSLGPGVSLRTLLTAVLDKAIEAVRADRGLLVLMDATSVEVSIARNLEGETIEDATDYCRSIIREVSHGKPILAVDVPGDERFHDRRSVTLYEILSLMCVPLRLADRVLGAVYFDSRSGNRLFRPEDLRLIEAYSSKVSAAIAEAQDSQRLRERRAVINRELAKRYHIDNLVGESPAMQRLFRMMEAVIRADCNVLVTGESGTGKELVARAIHYAGVRRLSNFVPLDCGAIPEHLIESELFGYRRGAFTGADTDKKGLFEAADGGTLFLDEITNTSLAFQAKLLRALQSGEFRRLGDTTIRRVDARIIAATNADVDRAMNEGRFRDDLYYRLNVVTLSLPPLRERREDIPLLAEHFARHVCETRGLPFHGIGRGALARLEAYSWPGNVRELEHAIEAALVMSGDGMVRREALPAKVLGGDLDEVRDLLRVEQVVAGSGADPVSSSDERACVEAALARSGGDKSRAARLLGWTAMNTEKTPCPQEETLHFLRDERSWRKSG